MKGIDYSPIYLERFFRNLLLGEQWDLRNRYLHIHPTEEWRIQPNLAAPTSTPTSKEQTPIKHPSSTHQVVNKFHTKNQNIIDLITIVGDEEISVKNMMVRIGLKDRVNFMNLYLNPAIAEGYVRLLYPDKPRHPRQKYLLTVKGLSLYKEITR